MHAPPPFHCRSLFAIALAVGGFASLVSAEAPLPTVPPGWVIEQVAAPPLVEHPVMAGFDEQGRLFVADNAGMNLPAEELLAKLPNKIRRLEDTDGDGRFDRSTVFADKMTFPMGALWHNGALFVASPPYIWRLEDTDGDGVADRRDAIVGQFGFVGNAADIHGCFLGPEGRIYWTDGRHGHNFVDSAGKTTSKGLAARIFSCRADGSDVRVHCGGGMDNPVEVDFTDEGEMLGTMTFYNPDEARHDALVHFVHGGVYPRKHACTSEFKRTGELMPALSLFDVVAPSGMLRIRGSALGVDFTGNVFTTQFNTHKVVRHQLARSGATFVSADSDFLVSTNPDFHPTDVVEDADGSLLVVDTGGWFRIGCPTSQVAKPEIGGAIYRIRKQGATPMADLRGLKLPWADASAEALSARLAEARPAVRERAIAELARRGAAAIESLERTLASADDATARRNAVWALVRIDDPRARTAVRGALEDHDPSVRQAAAYCAGARADADSQSTLARLVGTDMPPVRREAATALGRIGRAQAVPALLDALASPVDRFLEHALIYALIEIDDRAATLAGLSHPNTHVRRGALVALDQMDSGRLTSAEVVPLLDTDDGQLRQAALDIVARREGWTGEITALAAKWLAEPNLAPERLSILRNLLLAFCRERAVQELLAAKLADKAASAHLRRMLLDVMASAEADEFPAAWMEGVETSLRSPDAAERRAAAAAAIASGKERFDLRLLELGADDSQEIALRVAALRAAARHERQLDRAAFALLVAQVKDGADVERLAAAEALGAATLDDRQLNQVADVVAQAAPLELRFLVRAFRRASDSATGKRLVEALDRSPGLASLGRAQLVELLKPFPIEIRTAAEPLVARLEAGDQRARAALASFQDQPGAGDAQRGREVFFSRQAACSTCHRAGNEGGRIGPDLSKVGSIRTPRDLAESILLPSSSLARGYESYTVSTRSGQIVSGVLARETPSSLHLVNAERQEIRIPRADVDQLAPSSTSIMPQGLDKILSPEQLRDVIAFLGTLK